MIAQIYAWRSAGTASNPTIVDSPLAADSPTLRSKGHSGNGGLQGDSIGDSYPWSIRGIGDDWQAVNLLTGQTGNRYPRCYDWSYAAAETDCGLLSVGH